MTDLLETVNFIKDRMATKADVHEIVNEAKDELRKEMQEFREEIRGEFMGTKNRMGGIDNRIDGEVFARKDLEDRVRTVVPNLPLAPERV